jgi:hypothetical protein
MNHLFQQPVRLFLFAALMVAAATGHALPTISMNPVPAEKKITLTIDGLKESATILLQDEKGEVLLREITKEEEASFAKIINLSQLAAGNYFLRVKTSLKEVVQPFELTNSEAIIQTSKQKEFFTPIIKSSGDFVDISFFNGKAGNVEIAIFDQKGELVFQEALQNVVIVQKRYNVNNLRWGDYTFRLSTAEQSHLHPFSIAK